MDVGPIVPLPELLEEIEVSEGFVPRPVSAATERSLRSDFSVFDSHRYIVGLHLAARRMALVLGNVFEASCNAITKAWRICPEGLGIDAPNDEQRETILSAIVGAMPADWVACMCVDPRSWCKTASSEVPEHLFRELREFSSLRKLNVSFDFEPNSSATCRRMAPGCFDIRIHLSARMQWAVIRNPYDSFVAETLAHELGHIRFHSKKEHAEEFRGRSNTILYPFRRCELIAESAGAAMRWANLELHGPFRSFRLADTSVWHRGLYFALAELPEVVDLEIRGKPLSYWRRCFERLVRIHLNATREAAILFERECAQKAGRNAMSEVIPGIEETAP